MTTMTTMTAADWSNLARQAEARRLAEGLDFRYWYEPGAERYVELLDAELSMWRLALKSRESQA